MANSPVIFTHIPYIRQKSNLRLMKKRRTVAVASMGLARPMQGVRVEMFVPVRETMPADVVFVLSKCCGNSSIRKKEEEDESFFSS